MPRRDPDPTDSPGEGAARSSSREDAIERHPPLRCWYCQRLTPVGSALKDAILASRDAREGGPYWLATCPDCLVDGMIEETRAGRWFLSPAVKVGILDYLFAPRAPTAGGDGAVDSSTRLLAAIAWHRDNEARRRHFFERDGDRRYSGISVLKLLWPWGEESRPPPRAEREPSRAPRSGPSSARDRVRPEPPPPPPRPPTPQEILGVAPGATAEEIRHRFRLLAVQYHPDKVHHLGKEYQQEAHRRFILLQRAYEEILRESPSG